MIFKKCLEEKYRNKDKSHLLFHVLVFILLLVLLCGSKPAKENVKKKDQMSIN